MTRIPARPTLKLPVKTTPTEGGEAASKGRKPVRSGFKAPKPTVAQRAKRHETIATRSAAQKARESPRPHVMPKPAAEKPRAPVRNSGRWYCALSLKVWRRLKAPCASSCPITLVLLPKLKIKPYSLEAYSQNGRPGGTHEKEV